MRKNKKRTNTETLFRLGLYLKALAKESREQSILDKDRYRKPYLK